MPKKIFRIGLPRDETQRGNKFLTRQNLLEFDIIIWDPRSLLVEIGEEATNAGENLSGLISEGFGLQLESRLRQRTEEILEYVQSGRDLIIIGRMMPILDYGRSHYTHSFELGLVGGLGEINWKDNHGQAVEWVGPPSIIQDFPDLTGNLEYSAMCEPRKNLVPLYQVPNSDGVVGGYVQKDRGGYIIFGPHTRDWAIRSPRALGRNNAYVDALANVPDALRALKSSHVELPTWSNAFLLPEEKRALDEIAIQQKAITEAEAVIAAQENSVLEECEWKYLFTAFDEPLVGAALRGLECLGIKAVRGPKNHADIIACYEGHLAVLEVKGKTASAARKNAEQCKVWISELTAAQLSDADERANDTVTKSYLNCLKELGVTVGDLGDPNAQPIGVKGILLINAYRDLPLDRRTEAGFPHPMLRTIAGASLCALTTLQLLGMVLKARMISSEREKLARLLFDHVGVISEYVNWKDFLSSG